MAFERKYKDGRSEWELVSKDLVEQTLQNNYHNVSLLMAEMQECPGRIIETKFSYFKYVADNRAGD